MNASKRSNWDQYHIGDRSETRGILMSMDDRTAGPDWSGPVRGPDFWSEILFGPVRGPDFGPDFYVVRYVVRILVRIFLGPVRGPEFGPKIRSGADNPDRYGFRSGFPN